MSKRAFSSTAPPAVLAALPLLVQSLRALTNNIWFWGDQALIDIEARDSLDGRNLLGVYDRYGWHHLGPMWLLILGVARWLGAGSASALVFGSGIILAASAAGIVVVAGRLRPGLTVWWAALLVVAFEWVFGADRLGTVWAPYAIALPAALIVLLVADVVTGDNPWGPTLGLAACATFLAQTDISTAVLVAALVVSTPVLRAALRRRGRGWPLSSWHGPTALVGVLAVLWLPPAINLFTTGPNNVSNVLSFMGSHPGDQPWGRSLRAMDTILGSFPFRTWAVGSAGDARLSWLVAPSAWAHPWFPAYVLLTAGALALAVVRRRRAAAAVGATTLVALLAGGLSVHLVYGPLFPYLVYWMSALAVPAWVAWWLALAPGPDSLRADGDPGRPRALARAWAWVQARAGRAVVPGACAMTALAVTAVYLGGQLPMAGVEKNLGRNSWRAVAAEVDARGVQTVYIDIVSPDAMPDAAAVADMAVRRGRRVELNRSALYFLDPSFAPRSPAQVDVLVCCGRHDRALLPPGARLRGKVGGQGIYVSKRRNLYLSPVAISPHGVLAYKPGHRRHRRPAQIGPRGFPTEVGL